MLVAFFAVMLGVGFYCRRHSTNVDGFVLGGRAVGPWLTAFAYGTSYFSAVIFVGYAGQFGWAFGMASTWIGVGNAIIGSLLAWVVLGRRTRVMTQHLGSKTMPDFFAKRYDSTGLKIAASVIVFIFLIPYTASLYNGLSSLFNMAFGIPYWVVIAMMALLTGVYVIFGGYMATAINDFIQGLIMLVGIVAVVLAVISSKGGFMEAYSALAAVPSDVMEGAYASFLGPNPVFLFFVVMLTSLGTWGLPQMIGKFYSIKNEKAISTGTVISTIFAVIVAGGCYFLGGFARLFDSPAIYSETGKLLNDKIIPSMLQGLSPIIISVVIVLVLSASMSTLSSLVLTSSSTLTLDVIVPARERGEKKMKEGHKLTILRLFVVFFIIVSAIIAIVKDMFPDFTFIAQMMGVSWGALAGAFIAPFLYGLYWKRTTVAAVAVSFITGVGVETLQLLKDFGVITFTNPTLSFIFTNSLYSGVIAMALGLVLVPVVSLLTPKPDRDKTNEKFSCYEVGS